MTYKELENYIDRYKKFSKKHDKLDEVVKLLGGYNGVTADFAYVFMEDYLHLLEKAANDTESCITWFVFDNDWGRNERKFEYNGRKRTIKTLKQLYDFCLKPKN